MVQNKTKSHRKDSVFLLKNVVLKVLFRDEGHVYAKYLSNSLTIYPKWHRFHFFSRGIPMYISILTGVQNGRISHLKDSIFLLKNVLLLTSFP